MEETFTLSVDYGGKEINLPCRLQIQGYTHRFIARVNDTELSIEKDEEGNYRAIAVSQQGVSNMDAAFVQAIVATIQNTFG